MTRQRTSNGQIGFLFIALSAILFGSIGVATKGVFSVAATNAYSITLLRELIALPALFGISRLALGNKFLKIARSDLRIMILAGLMLAIYQVSFVLAVQFSNVTISTLVTLCTAPVVVALFSSVLLKERLSPLVLAALACALVGVVFLVGLDATTDMGTNPSVGIGFALLTALGSGLFQICGRMLANRYHPMQSLSVFFLVAALVMLPLTLANGLVLAYPLIGWAMLLQLGIGVSVIGYGFLMLGLKTTPATMASIVAMFEPLTGTILAWLIFNERLSPTGWLGGTLLLAAMVLVYRANTGNQYPVEETVT